MKLTQTEFCRYIIQWRKPGPQFGGDGKKILPSPQIQKLGDGEKLTVS